MIYKWVHTQYYDSLSKDIILQLFWYHLYKIQHWKHWKHQVKAVHDIKTFTTLITFGYFKVFQFRWNIIKDINKMGSAIVVVEDNGKQGIGQHSKEDDGRKDPSLWRRKVYSLTAPKSTCHGKWVTLCTTYARSFHWKIHVILRKPILKFSCWFVKTAFMT